MPKAPTTEDRLRAVARGDLKCLGALSVIATDGKAPGLDDETYQLVQIAALAAIDAPLASWLLRLEAVDDAEIPLEKILDTLIAVGPVVGTAKVVSASEKIVRVSALGAEFGVPAEG